MSAGPAQGTPERRTVAVLTAATGLVGFPAAVSTRETWGPARRREVDALTDRDDRRTTRA